jgi:predicted nucleic acid-binding protein
MPDGPIVCNAGPLIALSMVGQLDLLRKLYRRVIVPEAVVREVVSGGLGRIGASQIADAEWLERSDLAIPEPLLALELGPGEAAVLATGYRLQAQLVLIDERRARRIAEQAYGLRVKGSAGILISAKRAGLVSVVVPHLNQMVRQGYFLSRRLLERAAAEAGE